MNATLNDGLLENHAFKNWQRKANSSAQQSCCSLIAALIGLEPSTLPEV